MRIVAWNIRAGGGARVAAIAEQVRRWEADIVCLCEFRATAPSTALAGSLASLGLEQQQSTADPSAPGVNALLVASRYPLRPLTLRRAPLEPRRWLAVEVGDEAPFALALMHIPNMVTGRKLGFLEAVEAIAARWRRGPAVFLGDTNCGWPGIDEETSVFGPRTEAWLESLARRGWLDAFRYLHPGQRFFTWYSPNAGNGFRLDQAFVNRRMMPRLLSARYEWGRTDEAAPRAALSDHAALLLQFD